LWGVSLAALVTALGPGQGHAQTMGALMAATHQATAAAMAVTHAAAAPSPASASTSAAMAAAVARAARNGAQLNQALTLAQQAQAAARAAAMALTPTVPDGLGVGGLQPVAKPVAASADPTGLNTWQGASAPTASATNPDQITIVQTDPRALLSWQTFNVGRNTTLTFQQQIKGVDQASWVVLNRVVGQIDPATGLRDANTAPAPSQILGAIKAPGMVLVINQNGVIFSPTAQVNVGSLVATSLEIGQAFATDGVTPLTIAQRNTQFLSFGLLGYAQQASSLGGEPDTFSAQAVGPGQYDPLLEGEVQIDEGASITSADTGFLMFLAPKVVNSGQLSSADGEIALQSGRRIDLTASQGSSTSVDPNVRGLVVSSLAVPNDPVDYVQNSASAIIQAPRGYVSVGSTLDGAVIDAGVILSTTSVSENGDINLFGGNIEVSPGAVIAITPDSSTETLPQDPTSLADFKPSVVRIGDTGSLIDIGKNSLIMAPGGNISIGADPGGVLQNDSADPLTTRVFVDSGAVIDAAGLTDVLIPASRNSIKISPVTANELADSPAFRNGFLNGVTVYVDPRLSGVNANGVAWVGSPLISAKAYAEQVGVSVSELMTSGGNVTLGAQAFNPRAAVTQSPDVIVKAGATIDISGGWKTYQAGQVTTSELVDSSGQVIPIADANPDDTYVAVYNGFTVNHPRWGFSQTYTDPVLADTHYEGQYTEGLDAGTLTIKASAIALDGKVYAGAFAGPEQILGAQPGTATGTIYGDQRALQAAPSQLPAGGYLDIQALGLDANGDETGGGGDIVIAGAAEDSPLPASFTYGQNVSIATDGSATIPSRPATSILPTSRLETISLDADAISQMGLSQLSVQTSGAVSVAKDATINLAAGGVFDALAGRSITVDGSITAPSGSINLTTAAFTGSVFTNEAIAPGSFDIVINGELNVAGRWANDYQAAAGQIVGSAYLGGGEITLTAAPRITEGVAIAGLGDPLAPASSVDASGSILINPGSLLNVSGGGYVAPNGALTLTAKGGDLSLFDQTTYFEIASDNVAALAGGLSGFRVSGDIIDGLQEVPVNPGQITARVSIADGSIEAQGFGGGGTFTLSAAAFDFGAAQPSAGAALPLDFFSKSGFANYDISSYGTDLLPNTFTNGLGGYNAVLATQVVTVGAGQTLSLTQSMFSPVLNTAQVSALQTLATGASLYSVMQPEVPTDAWDQKAVNLTLGGLLELHVAKGGQVIGSAGGVLTVSQLYNQGVIRIPGGAITQSEILPAYYAQSGAIAVHSLSQVFTTEADGSIDESAPNALGLEANGVVLTNAQVAASDPIYLLGDLDAGEGVRLAPGSVTDLSGAAIVNPRATPRGSITTGTFVTGTVVGGGTLTSTNVFGAGGAIFHAALGGSVYSQLPTTSQGVSDALTAAPGSRIDLSGAQAVFDEPVAPSTPVAGEPTPGYAPTLMWSNGGALTLDSGGTLTGSLIDAGGGAPLALGGTLSILDPILYQRDPSKPTFDAISADAITKSGFATLIAQGGLDSVGKVTLSLARSLFVETPTSYAVTGTEQQTADQESPVLASGGVLEIDAPYIALDGAFQAVSNANPDQAATKNHSILLKADAIDVTGAVVFDASVGQATLSATGDVRLIGVAPSAIGLSGTPPATLIGQLAANGDVTIQAAQVYPTTGSTFSLTSAAADGTITFKGAGATPATPYSAGGSLLVQASTIVQDGVVRAPLGALTLGADTASAFAPATSTLTLEAGSTTSVSADGLSIPYGTTTDQVEWYFTPTDSNPLTAPPAGVLQLAGGRVSVQSGATVDLKGGGDVYAYEFVSGTGGSRDVLDRYNTDQFSSNNGCQYADCRQVYAIVPGLSSASVAALDPIYSSDYASLYGPSQAGLSVYLNGGPGLAAGWYTLLPAKYALLPGGMRVVQDTGAATPPAAGGSTLPDGTIVTSGRFGVAGTGSESSGLDVFDVQSQAVINSESQIALTYGDATFAADAAHNGTPVPQLPIDAGRLILDPITRLALDAPIEDAPADGGRGAEVDISGKSLTIAPADSAAPEPGTIVLTDAGLNDLDAASLFLGGVRTDNADGTTSLDITSRSITVDSGVSLAAPEILMAVDGKDSVLDVSGGATITATGAVTGESSGDYLIQGVVGVERAQGAFLRVSNGPQRLLTRLDVDAKLTPGSLTVGAATLKGASVELNSDGSLRINAKAKIEAASVALGAAKVTFAQSAAGISGLVITPSLSAQIGDADLAIESANIVDFASGHYAFDGLHIDAPGMADTGKGAVSLDTGVFQLSNDSAASAACGAAGALACGGGAFDIAASEIDFGSGAVQTYGAGAVTLRAKNGMFIDGDGAFETGPAALILDTPFLGDRATGTANGATLSLTLASARAVDIVSNTPASDFKAPAGTPGADLTIDGARVSIKGTELRATAGALKIVAADGLSISGGALLATPGYSESFGDAADSTTQSAPGGLLSLTAVAGDISLSSDSRLSIGGGQGAAGTLMLSAQAGQVEAFDAKGAAVPLASVFEASAPDGGASLDLNTGGSFDLSSFAENFGALFNGAISIETGAGALQLRAGDSLTASSVQLVADGGQVSDAGLIDTSGVNGGAVSLYGARGVDLKSTAVIKAVAEGYGAGDTRQAQGGAVTLGVDGAGAIDVETGAVIDVSAAHTQNRLVAEDRTDGTYYSYVAGDLGGVVTFSAPVVAQSGRETVDVSVAGAVTGASSVVLEGVRSWDLASLADNPRYVGVTISGDRAILDLAATGSAPGVINPLADVNGPISQFIQTFDVSADYGALGGLATASNFHARPGVELDYSGDIVLKSNWNLGAGVVNVAGAVAAGLMAPDPGLPGRYVVVAGDEGQLLAQYTTALYRVGGTFYGEPGILTLRAGGNLDLKGSVTDGFFQFGDQTDPKYLDYALGGGNRVYQGSVAPYCVQGACSGVDVWSAGDTTPSNAVEIDFPSPSGLTAATYVDPAAPYSAEANSPAALGSLPGGKGDSLGSAQLFPLLPSGDGGATPVSSWSYQLVAGADLQGAAGRPSADPLAVVAGSGASVTVEGQHLYSYSATKGVTSFADSLDLQDSNGVAYAAGQWEAAFIAENPGLQGDSYTTIDYGMAGGNLRPIIAGLANTFFNVENPGEADVGRASVTTTLDVAAQFMAYVSDHFSKLAPYYAAPRETGVAVNPTYAVAPSLVRTGNGAIQVAAPGDIDLRNGATPVVLTKGVLTPVTGGGAQLGGAAIYTAGVLAALGTVNATDAANGVTFSVDLGANAATTSVFASNPQDSYSYGAGPPGFATGYAGILIANPVYADAGGPVSLDAGGDVLGRRNTLLESELGGVGLSPTASQTYSWIGSGVLPWRTGVIGAVVEARINPQLFNEGVGTLAGGDISITAGGNVSDLSIVSADSLTTGLATPSTKGGSQGAALVALGGGAVSVFAAGDILGGRLDVASGEASLTAEGSVASAGTIEEFNQGQALPVANTLRVLLSDATVQITAGGSASLQGVGALGVDAGDINSRGYYSPAAGLSILANGPVAIANLGGDVATGADASTDNTVSAVYPGSLRAVSFTGDLNLVTLPTGLDQASDVYLYPSPTGTLTLLAAGDIAPLTIAQSDADPTLLPGAFSTFTSNPNLGILSGVSFVFPAVLPDTSDVVLRELHNSTPTHTGDEVPNRIAAGGDIIDVTISAAKQTRVTAGTDIVNMVFLGQNLTSSDITRIAAGRDITATTTLETPATVGPDGFGFGAQEPALQGDTFVLGGPGALFIEAGRDAGPFLNSAVTDGVATVAPANTEAATGSLTYGGGILTVGNLWNPWLASQGASIFTEFGVAKGQDFAGLISTYLQPSNFANLPDYEFEQTTGANGTQTADRTQEIYTLGLIEWMRSIAPNIISRYDTNAGVATPSASAPALVKFMQKVESGQAVSFDQALAYLPQLADQTMPLIPWLQLNDAAGLTALYGSQDVSYQQAFAAFQALPQLVQREFLLKEVYFNELIQTSIPASPSYLKYSRGYEAINTLFPAAYGYTQNSLSGGPAGATSTVETGNLDLRLATIQTEQGGDILILGPGGRVLAGSAVATAVQASRRVYSGGLLYSGGAMDSPLTAQITAIPAGYEGILTLRGGSIDSFTDQDFLLNQSRAFAEEGGDVAIWSSNADVNAGEGPKTTADVPPVSVLINEDGYSVVNTASAVSGAGIGAFQPDPQGLSSDVFLMAPRGTVDAGAAGVRSSGAIFIAAYAVANTANITAGGAISGAGGTAAVNVSAQSSANSSSAAAAQAAQAAAAQGGENQRPLISVEVLGYLADETDVCGPEEKAAGTCQ